MTQGPVVLADLLAEIEDAYDTAADTEDANVVHFIVDFLHRKYPEQLPGFASAS